MRRGLYSDRFYDADILDRFKEELMGEMEERLDRQRMSRRRYPRRDLNRLGGEIHDELRAIRDVENRLRRSRVSPGAKSILHELLDEADGLRRSRVSPGAKSILHELLDEADDQGLTADDLLRALPRPSLTGRLTGFLQSRNGIYLMLALLVVLATPAAREGLKPVLKKLVEEVNNIAEQARSFLAKAREGVEDIVAEAKFDKIKDEIEKAVHEDFPVDPGPKTN